MQNTYSGEVTRCHAIVDYVTKHPGCTRAELLIGVGSDDMRDALPTYCRKHGLLFVAGPRGSQRYYATAEAAEAADPFIRAEVEERKARRERLEDLNRLAKLRAQRAAEGRRMINTRPRQSLVDLEPGVLLHPDVKVTICPAGKDQRYTFNPPAGWVGQITRDWREGRLQGMR